MALKIRPLPDTDETPCHECGKRWWEALTYGSWDHRPYVEVRGAIGRCLLLAVLCPDCAEEAVDAFWVAEGWSRRQIDGGREGARDGMRLWWLAQHPGLSDEQYEAAFDLPEWARRTG